MIQEFAKDTTKFIPTAIVPAFIGYVKNKTNYLFHCFRQRIKILKIKTFSDYIKLEVPKVNQQFMESLLKEESPFQLLLENDSKTLESAERIIQGSLRVFTKTINLYDSDFSWHKDFYSGHIYPLKPFPKIRIIPNQGHDIIVPWELSRLQFIPTLIRAHQITNNAKYAVFFQQIVDSWISANPYLFGVNWKTAMDVAIRGINLLMGLSYFQKYLKEKMEFYLAVLWGHAIYIYEEDLQPLKKHRNNHFLVSIVGLLAISSCFEGNEPNQYVLRALEHFKREILRQFYSDGGNFESAVNYHQLSLETALIGIIFATLSNNSSKQIITEDHEIKARLIKASQMVSDYMNAYGASPQFGDSSDARILIYKDYFDWDPLDHAFIKEIAEYVLKEDKVFSRNIWQALYPDSGYGFYKNKIYGMCAKAGPRKYGEGTASGHNHCDRLSLVLCVNDVQVLVDSGTYCYTPDIRTRFIFKQTRSHNAVMIDGQEQAETCPEHVFGGPEEIEANIYCTESQGIPIWIMEQNGYSRFKNLGIVARRIRCLPKRINIEETIEGSGEHIVDIIWHLHPKIRFKIKAHEIHFFLRKKWLCQLQIPLGYSVTVEQSYYSPAYYERVGSNTIRFSCKTQLPSHVVYGIEF